MSESGDEVVDQLKQMREKCSEDHHVVKLKQILEECNTRLSPKNKPKENCHMEMVDYVQALDHCAMPKAFKKLK